MFKYQFTSTVDDLLEAEQTGREFRSIRTPFRWIIIVLGIVWFVMGILAFDFSNPSWRPIFWLGLGGGIFYYFVVGPYLRRREIKKNNAYQQDLLIEFNDEGMKIVIKDVGEFNRGWGELIEYLVTSKGVIFYFNDDVVNWLPRRVFEGEEERDNLIGFVRKKIDQNE